MLPLGQFVENPQQVDAGKQIPPAKLIVVSRFLRNRPWLTQALNASLGFTGSYTATEMKELTRLSAVNSGSS